MASVNNFNDYSLIGGTGNADEIDNYGSRVTIYAGSGNDEIYNDPKAVHVTIFGDHDNDTVYNNGSNAVVHGGVGKDIIYNHGLKVTVNGDAGNDYLWTSAPTSYVTLNGGAGDDSIYGEGTKILLNGNDGNDIVRTSSDSSYITINGGAGNDILENNGSNNIVSGEEGNDYIHNSSLASNDTLLGGAGKDTVKNYAPNVWINGNSGDDFIWTGYNTSNNVTLNTGAGNDTIEIISTGTHVVNLSEGNTHLRVFRSNKIIVNGSGANESLLVYANREDTYHAMPDVAMTVYSSRGDDTISGFDSVRGIYSYTPNYGNDVIVGFDEQNSLSVNGTIESWSLDGSDVVFKAGSGSVRLKNFKGNVLNVKDNRGPFSTLPSDSTVPAEPFTTIIGGGGKDTLFGTKGKDYFVYPIGEGADVIGSTKKDLETTLYRANDKIIIIDDNGLDDLYFTDKKNILTVGFKSDSRSKLTINKSSSLEAVNFYVGDDLNSVIDSGVAYTYGLTDDVKLNASGNKLTVKTKLKQSTVNVNAADIVSTAKTIDGSEAEVPVNLVGNSQNNVLIAGAYGSTLDGGFNATNGKGTSDKLYGGDDADVFIYNADGGNDAIYNYDGSKDKIMLVGVDDNYSINTAKSSIFKNTGKTITLTVGKGKLTIDKPGGIVHFVDENDQTILDYGVELPEGVSFNAVKTALIIDEGALIENNSFDVGDPMFADYAPTLKEIDASAYEGMLELNAANGKANTLRASKGGSTLVGGTGNDQFYGNEGADLYVYAIDGTTTGGNDIINNYGADDSIKVVGLSADSIVGLTEKGKDLLVNIGKNSITIKNYSLRSSTVKVKVVDEMNQLLAVTPVPMPIGMTYKKSQQTLVTDKNFNGAYAPDDEVDIDYEINNPIIDCNKYSGNFKLIDASKVSADVETLTIKGKSTVKNTIKAPTVSAVNTTLIGGTGADQFYGGSGKDTFIFDSNGGKDIIYNFASDDRIYVSDVSVEKSMFVESGKDVILKLNSKNTLTLKNASGHFITFSGADDNEMIYGYTLPSGLKYNANKTEIQVGNAAKLVEGLTIDLNDDEEYHANTRNVDLRKVETPDISVYGDQQNNVIYASDSNMDIYGGTGNDNIHASTVDGATLNYYYGGGKDIINNYDPDKVSIDLDDSSDVTAGFSLERNNFVEKGNDLIVKFDKSNTLTLKNAVKYINAGTMLDIAGEEYGWRLPEGLAYDARRTSLGVSNKTLVESGGTLDIDLTNEDYASTVKKINLQGINVSASLIGNSLANNLYASARDNTLEGGAGNDNLYVSTLEGAKTTIVYNEGDGKDVVYNFGSGDTIRLKGDISIDDANFVEKGKDIVINVGKGSITIKNAPREAVNVVGDAQTFTYNPLPTGLTYNAQKTTLTLKNYSDSTLDAVAMGLASTLKEINASALNGSISIVGNDNANVLKASKGGATLDGGAGDDTLVGGKGNDLFKYGDGNDIITNYTANQDVIEIAGTVTDGKLSGSNVELTIEGNTLTIKSMSDKKLTVKDANGQAEYLFTKTNNTLDKARLDGNNQLTSEEYWFMQTDESIEAPDELTALTMNIPIVDNALASVDEMSAMFMNVGRKSNEILMSARKNTKR